MVQVSNSTGQPGDRTQTDRYGAGRSGGTATALSNELECEAAYGDHMAEMAAYWMGRAQEAEKASLRLVAALVASAGGRIEVNMDVLRGIDGLTLERWSEVYRMVEVFRTKPTSKE